LAGGRSFRPIARGWRIVFPGHCDDAGR
jgi:hypothetical protein